MTRNLLIIAMMASLLFSCKKKEGPQGPQGPQGANGLLYTGVIAGHILPNDPYGNRKYFGLDGITVTLNDTTSTVTDTNGYYYFSNVATGSYNLIVRGTGYGGTMTGYMAFIKDTLIKNIKISQRPNFDLASFGAYSSPVSGIDSLVASFPSDTRNRRWIVFASNNPSVDQEHYLLAYIVNIQPFATTGQLRVTSADLTSAGFASGQTVYYAAYSYVVNDLSAFDEVSSGHTSYTAIGNAFKASTTAP